MGRIFSVPPSPWEVEHASGILAGLRYEAEHGALPDTPMWRMLERRHDLAPARFDRWHPNVGRMIEACRARDEGPIATAAIQPTPSPALVAAAVPEPSSLVLLCIAVAAMYIVVGWCNRWVVLTQARDVIDWILAKDEGGC